MNESQRSLAQGDLRPETGNAPCDRPSRSLPSHPPHSSDPTDLFSSLLFSISLLTERLDTHPLFLLVRRECLPFLPLAMSSELAHLQAVAKSTTQYLIVWTVILVWDTLCTLPVEARVLWPREWTLLKVVFLLK